MEIAETRPARRNAIFYGWFVVLGGVGLQSLQGALFNSSYGAYVVVLQKQFGWSKTTFSAGYSVQQLAQGALGPLQGWLIDRFGSRTVLRIGVAIFGGGFILFSRFHSRAGFFAAMLVLAFGASLGGFIPVAATVVNWFVRRRSAAVGLMSVGLGIGGFLAPVVAWSLGAYGWRASAFASGLLVLLLGLPLTQLMRHRPEPYGYLPDGDQPDDDAPASSLAADLRAQRLLSNTAGDFTVREAVRTRAFWLIAFGHASALLVVSTVNVYLVAYLVERLDYSVTRGAVIVTLVTTLSIAGQISGGLVGDRVSKRWLAVGCMWMHAAGLLMLAYATGLPMVLGFVVLHGLAWGIRGPQMQAIRADYFGRSAFATIYGVSMPIVVLGTVGGPMLAGSMADAFGNYQAAFTLLAGLSALGSLFWLFLRRPSKP